MLFIVIGAITPFLPRVTSAAPDGCTPISASEVTCSGNQSAGVSGSDVSTPPFTTLNVRSLTGAIQPADGTAGINFRSDNGDNLILHSGSSAQNSVTIHSVGDNAGGIVVDSRGHPTGTIFGFIPAGAGGSGGTVNVTTFGNISTGGDNAHGISAASRAGGYPAQAVDFLKGLLGSGESGSFSVATVNGQASNIGQAVAGDNGGSFTLNANGTYSYSLTGQQFTNLAVGATLYTTVGFTVTSTNPSLSPSSATLIFKVTKTASGLSVEQGTLFDIYGLGSQSTASAYSSGTVNGAITLRPDLETFVTQKLTDSGVSGVGRSVNVVNHAAIETQGAVSYGIFAQSTGGQGLGGSGGIFNGSDADPGSPGGPVTVENHADITTHGAGARGIYARSVGGDGGRGGDSGIGGNGGDGGLGAKGGAVTVTNHGAIKTESQSAAGIFAQSLGGTGGGGGSSGFFGGSGGSGGGTQKNDQVSVTNQGTIETKGNDSYGIFAQSVGGFAGSGGNASGIVAFGSSGGSAGQGGDVTIDNQQTVTTEGRRSHALFAQSVGGGGGNAGGAGGLVGLGGGGGTGGNGGTAVIINSHALEASGAGSYGIYAQSVGGGGGNGGDSIGLVGIGGKGSSTSDGGSVSVGNSGSITSTNHAIFAESIGGGGGNGGSSAGWVSVGGNGGSGGDGKEVNVNNSGNLSTSETNASAIFAQSVGGGGGNGGNSVAVGAYASVAVGGEGAGGGKGGLVSVVNDGGSIVTGRNFASGILPNESRCGVSATVADPDRSQCGDGSHGIFAQSVGGGGGNGGFAVAGSVGDEFSVSVAIGRNGGDGGDAEKVTVDNLHGDITTHGDNAHGIFAQSVGGGGGNGGFAVAAALSGGVSIAVGVGGKGGAGGDGKDVVVGASEAVTGNITTFGDGSHGIFAQSVGKGGGSGGFAVAGNINVGNGTSAGVSFGLGGSGGGGGAGGEVLVDSAADITTHGERSYGIMAQSVGGGGGNGGMSVAGSIGGPGSYNASVALGGSGGSGNIGGTVDVTNGGDIETWGDQSHAIFAQSVGGGGGNGGMAIAGGLGLGGNNKNLSIAVGGNGGSGSLGGSVIVRNNDSVVTHGESATGIYAQSVGGGGGSGGASFTGNASIVPTGSGQTNMNLGFAIGGKGGSGDNGGNVTIINNGSIDTWNVNSHGIYAQSVGGGGGEGGKARTMSIILGPTSIPGRGPCSGCSPDNMAFNLSMGGAGGEAGDGGVVEVTNNQSITTRGSDSHGIWAQSVGGGGGSGGEGAHGFFGVPTIGIDKTPPYKNISISMGGSQGSSGDGKAVTVTQTGNITTGGDGSFGVFAQSVGGGGGSGGHGAIGFTGTVGIGGSGGAAGDGGDVTVSVLAGNVETSGVAAHGIFAQSVGGGGGIAGNIDRGLPSVLNFGLGVGITKSSGNGGNGGVVTVTGAGNIHTMGDAANGIFAQSVGGGGGVAGDIAIGLGYAGSAGGNGAAGAVHVNYTGNITTDGAGAHGIFAQSGGGTAHNVQVINAEGDVLTTLPDQQNLGKNVDVTIDGSVVANGAGSNGIFLQSQGSDGNGAITVTVQNNGLVQGGSGAAAGVRFEDGAANLLTNRGTVTTAGAVAGVAISGTAGNETIANFGTVTGSVDLGAGGNAFNNKSAATFNAGSSVNLGAGNLLTNDGKLLPGSKGQLLTTMLTGNVAQSASGTYGVDLDVASPSAAADRVNGSGSATLAGKTDVNPINTGFALPGTRQATIFSAAGGLNHPGLALTAPPSAVAHYELQFPNPNDMVLAYNIDFAPSGLNHNQAKIGDYVNRVQLAGGSASFAPIAAALFGQADVNALGAAYNQLSPESYLNMAGAPLLPNLKFNNAMLSCRAYDGDFRFVRENECGWMTVGGSGMRQERTFSNVGFHRSAFNLAGGVQKAISDNWRMGFALGYERSWLHSAGLADNDAHQAHGGVMLKGNFGNTTIATSLSGGHVWNDSKRFVNLPTPGVTAKSVPGVSFVSPHARVAHAFDQGAWYLRPFLHLGVTYVHLHRFSESGAGAANLDVRSSSETYVTLQPALEIGGEVKLTDTLLIRPFAQAGLIHLFTGATPRVSASLQGAPGGTAPFTVSGKNDKNFAEVSLGADILSKRGINLRVGYTGQYSARTESHGGSLKLSFDF